MFLQGLYLFHLFCGFRLNDLIDQKRNDLQHFISLTTVLHLHRTSLFRHLLLPLYYPLLFFILFILSIFLLMQSYRIALYILYSRIELFILDLIPSTIPFSFNNLLLTTIYSLDLCFYFIRGLNILILCHIHQFKHLFVVAAGVVLLFDRFGCGILMFGTYALGVLFLLFEQRNGGVIAFYVLLFQVRIRQRRAPICIGLDFLSFFKVEIEQKRGLILLILKQIHFLLIYFYQQLQYSTLLDNSDMMLVKAMIK